MWSKLLNLLFIQLFILQTSAYASPGKYLTANKIQKAVTALKSLSTDQQKRLYLSILPLINKEDIKIVGDKTFFTSIIKNLSVKGDGLIVKVGNEKARITDIDFKALTAKFNGNKLDLRRPINEQLETLSETKRKTTFIDFLIPSAHAQAQKPPVPNKLKVIGLLAVGAVVAVLSVGGIAYGYLKSDKGSEMVVTEEEVGSVEQLVTEDCNESKDQVQKSRLGEIPQITQEFIQNVKNKLQMMGDTKNEAIKMNVPQSQMGWIEESIDCYEEVVELIEVQSTQVKDDSSRAVKDVPTKSSKKPQVKGASLQ